MHKLMSLAVLLGTALAPPAHAQDRFGAAMMTDAATPVRPPVLLRPMVAEPPVAEPGAGALSAMLLDLKVEAGPDVRVLRGAVPLRPEPMPTEPAP